MALTIHGDNDYKLWYRHEGHYISEIEKEYGNKDNNYQDSGRR